MNDGSGNLAVLNKNFESIDINGLEWTPECHRLNPFCTSRSDENKTFKLCGRAITVSAGLYWGCKISAGVAVACITSSAASGGATDVASGGVSTMLCAADVALATGLCGLEAAAIWDLGKSCLDSVRDN